MNKSEWKVLRKTLGAEAAQAFKARLAAEERPIVLTGPVRHRLSRVLRDEGRAVVVLGGKGGLTVYGLEGYRKAQAAATQARAALAAKRAKSKRGPAVGGAS